MKTKARGKATKVRLFLFIIAVMTNWPALSSAEVPEVVPSNEYTHPQNMISVDGIRRLNMFCIGSGSPTVILDAGGGGSTMVWRHVQGQIATVTRVCAYDRAGLGFSDEQTRASDVLNAVDDLHRLLVAASIRLPIVYVGHSIAGLYGVMFNASFPHDIAGAVFVDPSFPHQNDVMIATFSTTQREAWYKSIRKMLDDQQG
jgi:pimeloyl-ACP methyl ester carboxylesterase